MILTIKTYHERKRKYFRDKSYKNCKIEKNITYHYIFWKKDISNFKNTFGIEIPKEIYDYITCCPHTYIYGYYKEKECIILFSAIAKEEGKKPRRYDDNFISLTKKWSKYGDFKKYLPIGWLGYSGSFVLYEISSGKIFVEDENVDGQPKENALANSLVELIERLEFEPSYTV